MSATPPVNSPSNNIHSPIKAATFVWRSMIVFHQLVSHVLLRIDSSYKSIFPMCVHIAHRNELHINSWWTQFWANGTSSNYPIWWKDACTTKPKYWWHIHTYCDALQSRPPDLPWIKGQINPIWLIYSNGSFSNTTENTQNYSPIIKNSV